MDLVIDANILFAALIKRGLTAELLFKENFHLYAPEFILDEFEEYRNLLNQKTERTSEEFSCLIKILQRRLNLLPQEEINYLLEKAREFSPDQKDTIYIALALHLKCPIWSNDRILKEKQDIIKVYNTAEIMQL